jgi:phosphoglycolate phosphatase-like HAD superfamily hydrolase
MGVMTRPRWLVLPLACALVVPASAAADASFDALPVDVQRVERAVLELHDAKRDVAAKRAAERRKADRALKRCKRAGPGWERIRKVTDPSQKGAYVRGAKLLWRDLHEAALDGAALKAYQRPFDRFLDRFASPLNDGALQAGVESIRRRLAYEHAASFFASCRTFDEVTKPIRQFKPGVTADYLAGNLYQRMARYVPEKRKAAVRKHWPAAQEQALDVARARLAELGGDVGRATYFRYAYSLNG